MPVLSSQDVGMFDCLFEPSSQGEIVGAGSSDLSADFGDVPHMFFEAQQHINEQATADLSTLAQGRRRCHNHRPQSSLGCNCGMSASKAMRKQIPTSPQPELAWTNTSEIGRLRAGAMLGGACGTADARFTLFQMWGALNNKAVQGTPRLWSKRASKRSRLGQRLAVASRGFERARGPV